MADRDPFEGAREEVLHLRYRARWCEEDGRPAMALLYRNEAYRKEQCIPPELKVPKLEPVAEESVGLRARPLGKPR